MNKPMKLYTHIEFIKRYLSESGKKDKCFFCKYNPINYSIIDEDVKEFFMNKCNECIHLRFKSPKKYYSDNFKTLYDWEEGE